MAGTIGYDSTVGQAGTNFTSASNHGAMSNGNTYTAVANDEITDVGFYSGNTYLGDGSGLEVGVYDITSGISGATLVASATVNPIANSRNTTAITPVALVSGNVYCMAQRTASATSLTIQNGYATFVGRTGTLTGSSALAASFTDSAASGNRLSIFAIVAEAAAPASQTGTFDLPDVSGYLVPTVGSPFTSASNTVVARLGDGTDTADLTVANNPKAGWAVVEVVSALKTAGHAGENFVGTIDDGSQWYYPTADNTLITPAGLISTDSLTDIDMQFWDTSDSTWKQFTLLITSSFKPHRIRRITHLIGGMD